MRSADRIPEVIDALEKYWLKHQDLRFAQVVEILKNRLNCEDMFNIEDNVVLDAIKSLNGE